MERPRLWGLVLAGLLLLPGNTLAQVAASIVGTVQDTSGAVIPEVAVTVKNLETGASRTVATNDRGYYRALSLPVGHYEVAAEKTGFRAQVRTGIDLVVGQEAVVNLSLEVGEVQQSVTVSAEAPVVNTTTASTSGLVGERQVKDLPLNGRSFDSLLTLNPGATNFRGKAGTTNWSVEGKRPTQNLILMNGVEYAGASIVDVVASGLLGIDAVREFNVVSNNHSAEYGKRAGAQVSVVIQSGTNQLHGTAFEFLRNSALDAKNFFDKGLIPPFKRNNFGGALGGPLRKDQTFLFGSYEGVRQRLGGSNRIFVPDENARRGLLPNAQGVPTPVAGLNPAMLPYLQWWWPAPNGQNLGGGIAEAFTNPQSSLRQDFGVVRFDHTFSDNDSLSANYTVTDSGSLTVDTDPVFVTTNPARNQLISLQELHILSPSVTNTFIVGISRAAFVSDALIPVDPNFPPSLSFVAGQRPGSVNIGGTASGTGASSITAGGNGNVPHYSVARSLFTFQDAVQVIRGNHQLSAGVWLERLRSNESATSGVLGRVSFSNLQSILQGTVATFQFAANSTPMAWRSLMGAWYLQDAIQVRPNLTLRLGLRHEFTNGWNERNGRAVNWRFDPNGVFLTDPVIGNSVLAENNAKRLFGLRVGLAWDPFGKGKTSIRAGFGTSYDLQDGLGFMLGSSPPFNGTVTVQNAPLLSVVPIVFGAPVNPTCGPGVPNPCTTYAPRGVQNSFKTPTSQAWNFAVEQQLSPNMALRLAYVGSFAFHAPVVIDPNAIHLQICSSPAGCTSGGVGAARGAVPQGAEYIPVGTRPNPYLSFGYQWFYQGNASYNSLQVDLNRRVSRGLVFRANYTWAKNLDNGSGIAGSQATNNPQSLSNSYDTSRDWGLSALNVTHQVGGNFTYELPFGPNKPLLSGVTGVVNKLVSGWQLNGIVGLLSGLPFTPLAGSNRSGDGNGWNPDRPSLNPAFTGPVLLRSVNKWYDPNAFVLPIPGTYGNAGRNVLTGPGLATLDFSLFKSTRISERVGLQFRAEVFNSFNRANFGIPSPVVFSGATFNTSAGVITSTVTTSRQIQFGLKLIF
ncbi:MAG: hypothetical protein A3J28_03480 [Acidobacteria bacterium RIFCSPLOWO2_12_FULL_60_22]|nr:MAG: hypothetical protein A3J28_03480 [Acidobacteria bacterium RIFCSPLOWO2_12_FULL_60_22]